MAQESVFLGHTSCPNCGSRDNLGVYTDHLYCFGCRYYEVTKTVNPRLLLDYNKNKKKKNDNNNNRPLPPDYSLHIPQIGLKWLSKYHITADDIVRNRIGWSQEGILIFRDTPREQLFAPCMIFPVYDVYGNLLMWQGRYFGDDVTVTRYYTRGAKDCLHILGEHGIIVLVEDFISAIRISKNGYRAMPLWGSSINLDLLVRLNRLTDRFIIWLDPDKFKDAQKFCKRASQYYNFVGVAHTQSDPKCYTDSEITEVLDRVSNV